MCPAIVRLNSDDYQFNFFKRLTLFIGKFGTKSKLFSKVFTNIETRKFPLTPFKALSPLMIVRKNDRSKFLSLLNSGSFNSIKIKIFSTGRKKVMETFSFVSWISSLEMVEETLQFFGSKSNCVW